VTTEIVYSSIETGILVRSLILTLRSRDFSCIIVIVVLHVMPRVLEPSRTRAYECRAPRRCVTVSTMDQIVAVAVLVFKQMYHTSVIASHAIEIQSIKCRTNHAQHVQCGPAQCPMTQITREMQHDAQLDAWKLFLAGHWGRRQTIKLSRCPPRPRVDFNIRSSTNIHFVP